ncbi:hypothetical protein [Beijerinckia sp. L45]|uniref:hypothetical protein n=1 Tax=Beijerinckia sp. L45 TaxID=1641855 RepID=UPI00131E0AEC|nr:hypothetical protein [Beijerinckia sp. L45]
MNDFSTDRRDLLLAPLLAAAAASFGLNTARAAGVDPAHTIIKLADQIPWQIHYGYPGDVAQEAALFSALDQPGQYLTLIRWYPGHMSAPHFYDFDRLCMVLSGTWYVASGEDFNHAASVPVPAGSFVRRVAKSVHYDGVISGVTEPAVIAITGMGPTKAHRIEPDKPGWRHV